MTTTQNGDMLFKYLRLMLIISFCISAEYLFAGNEGRHKASDSIQNLSGNWFQQLQQCNFQINNPSIKYPGFINFCRSVYNWGDRTLNKFDSAYVTGTGCKWKLNAKSYNWHETYTFLFNNQPVVLHGKVNADLGISLNFMGLNIGYTWNVNHLLTGKNDQRKTFNFGFTCALFNFEITSWDTTGDTRLRKFGDYHEADGSRPDIPIDNLNHKAFNVSACYFFNHDKYSQAAAYNNSKYQLKSAGSWIVGIKYGKHHISMDFEHLPPSMTDNVPEFMSKYELGYANYTITGGYGYNLVLPHNWLYNVTILPSVGYKRTGMRNSSAGTKTDFGNSVTYNYSGKMALNYNYRKLYVSAVIRFEGGYYFDHSYTFFNTRESAQAIVGLRF